MKTLWVLFICALGLTVQAQVAYKCEDNFKVFEGRVVAKEYSEAYTMLPELRKSCPKVDSKLYSYGETILKFLIESALTPEESQLALDDLVALYGEQEKNFPGTGGDIKKTQLQFENKRISENDAFKAFNASFIKNRQAFTDFNALETYFNLFFKEYKSGKGITDEQYIEKFGEIGGQIIYAQNKILADKDALLLKQETTVLTDEEKQFIADAQSIHDAFDAVNDNISIASRDLLSCEKMEAYYGSRFEANKANLIWLEAMVSAFYAKKCFNSPVMNKGALAINTLKPTKQSAYRLGYLSLKKNNNKDAVKYLEQAASLEMVPEKKGDIYYEIASAYNYSDKAEAKKYALKAAEFNPKSGKPLLLLAEMYSTVAKECEINDFERKALGWLAIETAKKAEKAEPKYKATVEKIVERYAKKLPTKAEAKIAGKKRGDVITYGCWINEKITVPNL